MNLDHLAIAVTDLDAAEKIYRDLLQLTWQGREEVPDQKVLTSIFKAGSSRLELITSTAADSPLAGFLAKRGSGLHHICLEVDDLDAEIARLKASGVKLLNEIPRLGVGGSRIIFLHPKDVAGVLVELVEKR